MSAKQPAELRRGLERWRREDRRRSVARVDAYKRWLRRGSKVSEIPEIPSDTDYERWREKRQRSRP